MPTEILMPALSPTMEEGTLAKWLVGVGDQVRAGDVIAEIETDKATMEVEAVDEGTIAKIVVAAGTTDVPVNQVRAFEARFHEFMATKYPQVGDGLRTGKVLTKEIDADLRRAIEEFKKTFVANKPAAITKADL